MRGGIGSVELISKLWILKRLTEAPIERFGGLAA